MRTAFSLGRLCLRQKPQRFIATFARHERHYSSLSGLRIAFRPPPKPPRTKLLVWSLLTPATFLALSEEEHGDGKTAEEHMLEASRAEIAKELPDDLHGYRRVLGGIWLYLDILIVEPVATTFRFLHLVIIFVPVLATIPVIWFGSRRKDRDNERTGTLWWYSFLVHSMERAGPAFIKVFHAIRDTTVPLADSSNSSSVNGLLLERTYSLWKCAVSCRRCTLMPLRIPLNTPSKR